MSKQALTVILSLLFTILLNNWMGGTPGNAETPKLDGTNWKLVQWSGQTLLENNKITLEFAKERLGGSSGCNRYTTGYQIEEKTIKPDQAIASTQKACPPEIMSQEYEYLRAIQGVQQYAINSQGELQFFYRTEQGLGLLTFRPISG